MRVEIVFDEISTKYNKNAALDVEIAPAAAAAVAAAQSAQAAAEIAQGIIDTAFVTDAASGSVAHFEDGANNIPVKGLVIGIEPVQSGSGNPSPENVRAISGWAGCNVTVSPTADTQDGTTYSIPFGEAGTVYGGTLDVVSGLLTVDTVITTINDLAWTWNSQRSIFYTVIAEKENAKDNAVMCEMLPYKGTTDSIPHAVIAIGESGVASSINTSQPYIYCRHGSISTQAALKAAVGTSKISYKLATPRTYQLTPTEIKTLLGMNNIWSDTGDTEVEYRADTKLYIEKKLQ